MQSCQLVESHKSAGCGPVRSPETVPAQEQAKKQTKNNKAKTGKNTQPQQKTKQKRQREVGSQPAMGITCMMTSYVSFWEWPKNKKQNRTNTKHTNGPRWWVREATKLHAETRDPPSQDPRDHGKKTFRTDKKEKQKKEAPNKPNQTKNRPRQQTKPKLRKRGAKPGERTTRRADKNKHKGAGGRRQAEASKQGKSGRPGRQQRQEGSQEGGRMQL